LLAIINDILDFSKIEAGRLEFESIEFDLLDAIEDTRKILYYTAIKKGIELRFEMDPRLPRRVKGDPGRIRQVMLNLLSNAIKFTSKGHVALRVLPVQSSNPGVNLRFEVEDTGIGIPKVSLDRLFHAFTQADASTQRRFGGSGLGLSICKSLVELMGGRIGVESKEWEGSLFWFEVSLAKAAHQNPSPNREHGDLKPAYRARILVAEDNTVNQLITVKMLEKLGHHADVVANGGEVISALRHLPYDLVLMDCQMPEMDGYEATSKIRQDTQLAILKLPIIAMTANAMSGDFEKCLSVGMNDYLAKPVSLEKLADKLDQWLPAQSRKAI